MVAALIVAVVFAASGGGDGETITTAAGTPAPAASTEATEPAELTIPAFPTFPDLSLPETPVTLAPAGSIPPATQTPEGLGDDPQLDELARACYDGDMESCDQLYGRSDQGSDYETYGDTCAGRQDRGTGQYCRESFPS